MSATGTFQTSPARAGASLRAAIRVAGFVGLALVAITVAMSDVVARAPADAKGIGPVLAAPSAAFPFGTDLLGRGMLSETLHGLTVTLTQGLIAMLVTLAAGGFAGFVAARLPWRMGAGLRWAAGILGAVPALLLAILVIGVAGREFAAIAAGIAASPLAFTRSYDRARALAASRHAEFARITCIPNSTLLRRDLVYDFRDSFLANAARALAAVVITLSTVSFLGFGAVPPNRDLGLMVAAALPSYDQAWWTALFPALALLLVILFARLAASLEEGERP